MVLYFPDMDTKAKAKEEACKEQSCLAVNEESDEESEQTGTSLSSSSSSSPLPVDNLGPVFEIKGVRAAADSSVLTFRVSRIDDPENRESWWEVTRSYEEFEAFNRLLLDCQKYGGIIFPPLPPPMISKFEESFAEGPIIHRKQIERYCLVLLKRSMQSPFTTVIYGRYLQLVCSHPTLGRSQALTDILSPTYVTPDKTIRKGIFAKLAESFSGSSQPAKVPLRDIEDFFQNERDWSTNYSVQLKMTLDAVLNVVYSEKSITDIHSSGKWITYH